MQKEDVLRIRQELGLTQEEFAEKIGVTQSQVWRYEKGRTSVNKTLEILLNKMSKNKKK